MKPEPPDQDGAIALLIGIVAGLLIWVALFYITKNYILK